MESTIRDESHKGYARGECESEDGGDPEHSPRREHQPSLQTYLHHRVQQRRRSLTVLCQPSDI